MSIEKYSIILPVKNGGEYFKLCVKSILNQSYESFELHVLDNRSSDGSLEWISRIPDNRIYVHSSDIDLSIEDNWARIVTIPKAEFMTIIGHDDVLDSKYLSVIDKLISKYPDASLYQTHFRLIDERGEYIRDCASIPEKETSAEFLSARLRYKRDSFGTGYMLRSKTYDSIGGIPKYKNLLYADDALWLMIMQNSWKATAKEKCFSYRLHFGSLSGKPDPKSHLFSIDKYITFLNKLEKHDKSIEKVMNRYAADYFNEIFKYILIWALYGANENNEIFDKNYINKTNKMMCEILSLENAKVTYGLKVKALMLINKLPLKSYIQKLVVGGYKGIKNSL